MLDKWNRDGSLFAGPRVSVEQSCATVRSRDQRCCQGLSHRQILLHVQAEEVRVVAQYGYVNFFAFVHDPVAVVVLLDEREIDEMYRVVELSAQRAQNRVTSVEIQAVVSVQ